MKKYTRIAVEMMGRVGAGVISREGEYDYVRVLNKVNMFVMRSDRSVTPHLQAEGYWESWITAWLLNNVGAFTTFIDIGANTGYYTFLAHNAGARVHAFEPNKNYFKMMNESKQRLDLYNENEIIIHPEALSNAIGEAVLHIPRHLQGSASLSHIDEKWDIDEMRVQTTRLDEVLNGLGPATVIKIDAEGEEERIWEGAVNLFNASTGAVTVLLEYTPGAYSDKFLDKLEKFGDLQWINYSGFEEPVTKDWIRAQTDWVMLVLRKRI